MISKILTGYLLLSNEEVGLDRISEGSALKRPTTKYVKMITSKIMQKLSAKNFTRRKSVKTILPISHGLAFVQFVPFPYNSALKHIHPSYSTG